MENCPLNILVFLIDNHNHIYIGTIIKKDGVLYRGKCLKDDCDEFYRNAIIAWAYIEDSLI